MKIFFLTLIRLYQKTLSPFLASFFGASCRFIPTCSEYTYLAIQKQGVLKGMFLGSKRLLKRHPWGGQGYDLP